MARRKRTRKFGGQIFKTQGGPQGGGPDTHGNKRAANRAAGIARRRGFKVRIVKQKRGQPYRLWFRKKKAAKKRKRGR